MAKFADQGIDEFKDTFELEEPMIEEPTCDTRKCVRFRGVEGEDEASQVVTCDAFPDGIPGEIAYGPNKHLSRFPGDHGLQYKGPEREAR